MISKTQEQMTKVYEQMLAHSYIMEDPRPLDDFIGRRFTAWRGFAQDLVPDTGLTRPTVYKTIRNLTIVGCIKLFRHGASNTPSIYELLRDPTIDEWDKLRDKNFLTGRENAATPWTRFQDTANRLLTKMDELEQRVERIERAHQTIQVRDTTDR